MLKEAPAKQVEGEPRRRWFTDEYFDLIVWYAEDGSLHGFQLCYDRAHSEHALTWTRTAGWSHNRVDPGEENALKNLTPVLLADGEFPAGEVIRRFEESCSEIDEEIRDLVVEKAREYAGGG